MPTGFRAMPVLPARDVARAARLLERAFGFEVLGFWRDADGAETFGVLRLGTATLAYRRAAGAAPDGGWAAILFVDDAAAMADLARAAGLATAGPVDTVRGTRETEVTDGDGHVLVFAEDLRPGPAGPGL